MAVTDREIYEFANTFLTNARDSLVRAHEPHSLMRDMDTIMANKGKYPNQYMQMRRLLITLRRVLIRLGVIQTMKNKVGSILDGLVRLCLHSIMDNITFM